MCHRIGLSGHDKFHLFFKLARMHHNIIVTVEYCDDGEESVDAYKKAVGTILFADRSRGDSSR